MSTDLSEVDAAVTRARAAAPGWVIASLGLRRELLERAMQDTLVVSEEWVTTAQAAKGISRGERAAAEDWLTGVHPFLRNLRLLRDSVEDIIQTGRPQPADIKTRADGRVVIRAMSTDGLDRILLPGFNGDIVLAAGVDEQEAIDRLGESLREGFDAHDGQVAVVLGAGNVSSIPPMDALTQLFAHLRTVIIKMNPVNEMLGPILERALAAFVERDLVQFVYGGADVGSHLTGHDGIDAVHVTGSDKTHDAIVFGPGEDGARRKRDNDAVLQAEMTSELGNVTPVIVVPGPHSQRDLRNQADLMASMLVNNGGFNCTASRVVITHKAWRHRDGLLGELRRSLAAAEDRLAYYPGAADRQAEFVEQHPDAEQFGGDGGDRLPWTLLAELDPSDPDDIAFTTEAFCGLMGEVGLDAPRSVAAYLDEAVQFCNDTLWGTLGCTLLVHPASMRDPETAQAVHRAIDTLEYGTVAVNTWSGMGYATVSLPWGGAPGQPANDIQSGSGWVHNSYLVPDDLIDKAVLWAPFRQPTKPIISHTHRTAEDIGRRLVRLEATRDLTVLPGLFWAASRA